MTLELCNHGFWLHHCALCLKCPGECDYGNCPERAVTVLERQTNGRVVERRPMCARHTQDPTLRLAEDVARLMGGKVEDAGEFWRIAA